jgi:hypothetical protein
MPDVQDRDGELVFFESVPNGARIILSVIGLIPVILVPYELLIRPNWNGLSLFIIPPIVISIGAILVGGLFVAAGLLGLDQTLAIVERTGTIHYSYRSALVALRRKTYRFSDVARAGIKVHDWSDGPSTYGLEFAFLDGQKIEIARFENRPEAERYLRKVEGLLQSGSGATGQ